MKKLIIFASFLLLTGCSEPMTMTTVSEKMPASEKEAVKETMDVNVHLYSLEQNAPGYVIKAKDRDKWILTNASVVTQHPNVLVETSNKQLLKGTIVYIDTASNLALIHMRNSANVALNNYSDSVFSIEEGIPKSFTSFNEMNEDIVLDEKALEKVMDHTVKKGLSYEKRIEARKLLATYPKLVVNEHNKIEDYDKDTFKFDRDVIQEKTNDFIEQYNLFANKKENQLLAMIKNDEVIQIFNEWEVYGEKFSFFNPKVTYLNYSNYVYAAQFEADLGEKKPQAVLVTITFNKIDGEFYVTSFKIEENK